MLNVAELVFLDPLKFYKKIVKFTIFIPLNKVQLYKNLNEKAGKFITDIKKKRHRRLR